MVCPTPASAATLRQGFHTLIIGGGTAGCVLASRLSLSGISTLLVERGTVEPLTSSWKTRMPAARLMHALPELTNPSPPFSTFSGGKPPFIKHNVICATDQTVPQRGLGGRVLHSHRPAVLGGHSAITSLSYHRGMPQEYDGWGIDPWGGEMCEEAFEELESLPHQWFPESAGIALPGLPKLALSPCQPFSPLASGFMEGFCELQMDYFSELSACQAVGRGAVGHAQLRVNQKNGETSTSESCWLRRALSDFQGSRSLTLTTGTTAVRLHLRSESSKEVTTVEVLTHQNETVLVPCERVIMCAGAIQTPQLLQLSGIGSPEHLQSLDITCELAHPQVGENLHDQLELQIPLVVKNDLSLSPIYSRPVQWMVYLEWLLRRKGWGTSDFSSTVCLLRTDQEREKQQRGIPSSGIRLYPYPRIRPNTQHGCTLSLELLRPQSRGCVQISSPELSCSEVDSHRSSIFTLDPKYLKNTRDIDIIRETLEVARSLVDSNKFRSFIVPPEEDVPHVSEIRDRVLSRSQMGGTCALGTVVDASLLVKGTRNLYICDSSVVPTPMSCGLLPPVLMLAHRLSNDICGLPTW